MDGTLSAVSARKTSIDLYVLSRFADAHKIIPKYGTKRKNVPSHCPFRPMPFRRALLAMWCNRAAVPAVGVWFFCVIHVLPSHRPAPSFYCAGDLYDGNLMCVVFIQCTHTGGKKKTFCDQLQTGKRIILFLKIKRSHRHRCPTNKPSSKLLLLV